MALNIHPHTNTKSSFHSVSDWSY